MGALTSTFHFVFEACYPCVFIRDVWGSRLFSAGEIIQRRCWEHNTTEIKIRMLYGIILKSDLRFSIFQCAQSVHKLNRFFLFKLQNCVSQLLPCVGQWLLYWQVALLFPLKVHTHTHTPHSYIYMLGEAKRSQLALRKTPVPQTSGAQPSQKHHKLDSNCMLLKLTSLCSHFMSHCFQ